MGTIGTFKVIAKHWPEGTPISTDYFPQDETTVSAPTTFDRTAPLHAGDYKFLFWNTGRHLTNKRHVRWTFTALNWPTWTATAWFGTPPPPAPANPVVTASAFAIVQDGAFAPTPIDGAGSSFVNGPNGQLAYPWNGNDHAVRTEWGNATILAKDPLRIAADLGEKSLDFAGWLAMTFGGNNTGEFEETDGVGGVGGGDDPFFDHVLTRDYHAAKGSQADLLAAYGTTHSSGPGRRITDIIISILTGGGIDLPINPGDPAPEDILRIREVEALVRLVRAEKPAAGPLDLNVSELSATQLRLALTQLQSNIRRSEATMKIIDAALNKKNQK